VTFSTASPACTVVGSTVTFVAAGPCNVDANQAGSADFGAAAQVTQLVTVTKVPSTVTVGVAPTSTVFGQAATATATVAPALGSAAGSVQFSVDGNPLGTPVPLSGGAASLATAVDQAGNRSRRSITISLSVAHVSILGLAAHDGAYDVTLGGSYTLVVIGGPRPRYVDAVVAPQQPSGLDAYFVQDGTVNGQPRWVLGVTITTDMGGHELWNLGVLQGGHLHVIKVRVH